MGRCVRRGELRTGQTAGQGVWLAGATQAPFSRHGGVDVVGAQVRWECWEPASASGRCRLLFSPARPGFCGAPCVREALGARSSEKPVLPGGDAARRPRSIGSPRPTLESCACGPGSPFPHVLFGSGPGPVLRAQSLSTPVLGGGRERVPPSAPLGAKKVTFPPGSRGFVRWVEAKPPTDDKGAGVGGWGGEDPCGLLLSSCGRASRGHVLTGFQLLEHHGHTLLPAPPPTLLRAPPALGSSPTPALPPHLGSSHHSGSQDPSVPTFPR